ncbi:MAG: hypothetical protein ACE5G1_15070, partial [bacterium]
SLYGQPVSRRILALYDSQRGQTAKKNHIHANAEVILNHLGCIVEYWDLANGLPEAAVTRKYRGILTWFYRKAMNRPQAYLRWAAEQINRGRKFVVLGNLGAFKDAATGELLALNVVNEFCNRLGVLAGDAHWTENSARIELVFKDPQMVEFERSLDYELTNYEVYKSSNSKNQVYLKLRRNDIANSESDLVLTTPAGGFAAAGYVLYEDEATYEKQWRINPFLFFTEAFDLKDIPRPDVTTLNGLRVWSSHIDGDALISKSEIKPDTFCGEVIRDEILKQYKWPVSMSVVVAEVETDPKFVRIARSIYELDWVEAASHSYSHPFYWADDYDKKDNYPERHLPVAGYEFNLQDEIVGSVSTINIKLLPANKKVQQFFWTGNCEPTPQAMKLCQKAGLGNINGGDTVFDNMHSSYTNVAPLSVDVGGYRQIYAPNANENMYTNEWRGPYYGYKLVLQTLSKTDSPLRIKPIDIYYHFYSGEKWASLNALKEVIAKTTSQAVAPMFISDYIAMVQGFFSASLQRISDNAWKIRNYGKCTTMRFDKTAAFPDLQKSVNVLGFHHYQGSLYVHLAEGDNAIIVLATKQPARPYLSQASHRIADWRASKEQVAFATAGFGRGLFIVKNLSANATYIVEINREAKTSVRTDDNGTLTFSRLMTGPISLKFELAGDL